MVSKNKEIVTKFDVIKDKDKMVYFKMSKQDFERFLKYNCIIGRFITKKRPVPERLYNKTINLLIPIEEEIKEEYSKLYNFLMSKLLERYSNNKKYIFSYRNRASKRNYNLPDMLDECVHKTLHHHFMKISDEKEFCFKASYLSMQNYKFQLSVKLQKRLTHYKLSAISAYIAMWLGYDIKDTITYTLNGGQLPTNDELFHAVDNSTKKYQIKKRK